MEEGGDGREILRLTICIERRSYYFPEFKKRIVDRSGVASPSHGVWLELIATIYNVECYCNLGGDPFGTGRSAARGKEQGGS
jgi:hypothetical protein